MGSASPTKPSRSARRSSGPTCSAWSSPRCCCSRRSSARGTSPRSPRDRPLRTRSRRAGNRMTGPAKGTKADGGRVARSRPHPGRHPFHDRLRRPAHAAQPHRGARLHRDHAQRRRPRLRRGRGAVGPPGWPGHVPLRPGHGGGRSRGRSGARHPLPAEPRAAGRGRRRRDEGVGLLQLLWIVPALPAAGFVVLALLNRRLSRRAAALIGAGSVGLSAVVALLVAVSFITSPPPGDAYRQVLWTWFDTGGLAPQIAFYLDAMSVIFILVITVVGFLIHLYSTEFMERDEGFTRFFIYMNLFVAAMLVLVLADNLLLLYLGWEGVGLCSYLLISFWQRDPQNVYAGRKAFIVTRVGDTALIVGLFLLFPQLHPLEIQPIMQVVGGQFFSTEPVIVAAAALLLGGAIGESPQLPLQTWLPDAMAGPTPVSALIHAATMVTAGVYLIARTNVLYTLAPAVTIVVAIIGALTLLYAGFSALTQTDLKRVLAYSTISQIGYMFLALGVGAWSAAIFHFMTHAFFKALLFMSAGAVILFLRHEQNIFRMGGLRRQMPLAFWTFLIGSC